MKDSRVHFICSDSFAQISEPRFRGWIVHLLCLEGEGSLVYNHKCVRLRRDDALVLTRPDLEQIRLRANDTGHRFYDEYRKSLLPAAEGACNPSPGHLHEACSVPASGTLGTGAEQAGHRHGGKAV